MMPRVRILDRAYIDQRLCCWAGPSVYGHSVSRPTISPFNSVTIYQSMMRLSPAYRFSQQFSLDFIAQGSRQLAALPVNSRRGVRKIKSIPGEIARLIPKPLKQKLKSCLYRYGGRRPGV